MRAKTWNWEYHIDNASCSYSLKYFPQDFYISRILGPCLTTLRWVWKSLLLPFSEVMVWISLLAGEIDLQCFISKKEHRRNASLWWWMTSPQSLSVPLDSLWDCGLSSGGKDAVPGELHSIWEAYFQPKHTLKLLSPEKSWEITHSMNRSFLGWFGNAKYELLWSWKMFLFFPPLSVNSTTCQSLSQSAYMLSWMFQ